MSNGATTTFLGEILTKSDDWIDLNPLETYTEVSVRLWGKGVVARGQRVGSEIGGNRRLRVRPNEFILSRIDARNGAFGLVPDELDGAVVSNDFPAFQMNQDRLLPQYLGWLSRTPTFVEQCQAVSEGSTNRVRLKEDKFYGIAIPLPPVEEQRRIVAKIVHLAAKIDQAQGLRLQTTDAVDALIKAKVSRLDATLRERFPLTTVEGLAASRKGAMRSGPFGSALLHGEFVEEGVPAIGIADVQENAYIPSGRWHVTRTKAEELSRFRIKPRDMLITVMGTLGRTCPVPDTIREAVSTKHVWTITPDHKRADERWMSYWLSYSRSVREDLLRQSSGTAISGLNGTKIKATSLPEIPIEEQRRIVTYLDGLQAKVDRLKALQQKTAAELDALLAAILDKAFNGEL